MATQPNIQLIVMLACFLLSNFRNSIRSTNRLDLFPLNQIPFSADFYRYAIEQICKYKGNDLLCRRCDWRTKAHNLAQQTLFSASAHLRSKPMYMMIVCLFLIANKTVEGEWQWKKRWLKRKERIVKCECDKHMKQKELLDKLLKRMNRERKLPTFFV